jgi:hypothetical protein
VRAVAIDLRSRLDVQTVIVRDHPLGADRRRSPRLRRHETSIDDDVAEVDETELDDDEALDGQRKPAKPPTRPRRPQDPRPTKPGDRAKRGPCKVVGAGSIGCPRASATCKCP